jgi:predicted ATPase with chaperone activity
VPAALSNTRFVSPMRGATVNLVPADLPEEGGNFYLPIAFSILVAYRQLPAQNPDHYELVGASGLSGELGAIHSALSVVQ